MTILTVFFCYHFIFQRNPPLYKQKPKMHPYIVKATISFDITIMIDSLVTNMVMTLIVTLVKHIPL